MTFPSTAGELSFDRKLLLAAVGMTVLTVVFGLVNSPQVRAQSQTESRVGIAPMFDVASIKSDKSSTPNMRIGWISPDTFTATGATVQNLVRTAYGVQDNQISGAPRWLNGEKYDIEAKEDSAVVDEVQKLNADQRKLAQQHMIQALLADRFKLIVHRETRELPVYWLLISKAGKPPKDEGDCGPPPTPNQLPTPDPGKIFPSPCGGFFLAPGHLSGQKVSVTQLVTSFSFFAGRPVLDKTSLIGKYDISLDWTPEPGQFRGPPGGPSFPQPDPNGPSLFTAIQEQLGLKLESGNGPVEVIVIDHAEMPSEN